ncbi:MAG: hypothetical protein H0T68_07530 [Gemmatimonadales bacterium]|nr:hypothetical protein [Gemmatimonadales bacterium]
MTPARLGFHAALLLLAGLVVGCGDDDNLPDPATPNIVDTLTLGSLVGTPIVTPSGFSVANGTVRTDQSADFDFAYNIEPGGRQVFLPRAALGLPSPTTADPGLQRRDETFDEIDEAQSNGYTTEDPVPFALGDRFVVRSRVVGCGNLGVPRYAKLEIIGIEAELVILKVLANINCGYKGLEPGLPDR